MWANSTAGPELRRISDRQARNYKLAIFVQIRPTRPTHLAALSVGHDWRPRGAMRKCCKEVGDMSRFDNPRQLMAYLRLVPGEHSSGETRRLTGITKAGSIVARRLLVEAACIGQATAGGCAAIRE